MFQIYSTWKVTSSVRPEDATPFQKIILEFHTYISIHIKQLQRTFKLLSLDLEHIKAFIENFLIHYDYTV